MQFIQTVEPETDEYFPGAHAVHAVLDASPSTAKKVPAVQFVHVLAPLVIVYLPAGQLEHVLNPATLVYFLSAQLKHAVDAEDAEEYVPAEQIVHVEALLAAE